MGSNDAPSPIAVQTVLNDVSNSPPLLFEDLGFQPESFAVLPEEAEEMDKEPDDHLHPHRM
jgi:hypothetical protein